MKKKLNWILAFIILSTMVLAIPNDPHIFFGTIQVENNDLDGTINLYVEDVMQDSIEVTNGVFGGNLLTSQKLVATGTNGDTVLLEFDFNCYDVDNKTYSYQEGVTQELTLDLDGTYTCAQEEDSSSSTTITEEENETIEDTPELNETIEEPIEEEPTEEESTEEEVQDNNVETQVEIVPETKSVEEQMSEIEEKFGEEVKVEVEKMIEDVTKTELKEEVETLEVTNTQEETKVKLDEFKGEDAIDDLKEEDIELSTTIKLKEKIVENTEEVNEEVSQKIREAIGSDKDFSKSSSVTKSTTILKVKKKTGEVENYVKFEYKVEVGDHIISIPKTVAATSDDIFGKFEVIERDPVLRFINTDKIDYKVKATNVEEVTKDSDKVAVYSVKDKISDLIDEGLGNETISEDLDMDETFNYFYLFIAIILIVIVSLILIVKKKNI